MAFTRPAVSDFKARFVRDFPYDNSDLTKVSDTDITNALAESEALVNEGLFGDQTTFTMAYLFLTAHNLVIGFRDAANGLNGTFEWLTQSKAVDKVSQAFTIPQKIMDNPILVGLTETQYGMRYLMMIIGSLTGNFGISCGATLP